MTEKGKFYLKAWIVIIVLGAVITSLTGCAMPMKHAYKTEADWQREFYKCRNEAVQYAHQMGATANPMIIGPEARECMRINNGWEYDL
jgi:hypothetical protein